MRKKGEEWSQVYLGLGSNLNDRQGNIFEALKRLSSISGISVVNSSSLYETEPVGYIDQACFINAVVEIKTILSPRRLLDLCLKIECNMGRDRKIQKGPREIDVDILLYDRLIVDEDDLKIPHPAMHERRFVLVPLAEIAPDLIHPILMRSIKEILTNLGEMGRVDRLLSPSLS